MNPTWRYYNCALLRLRLVLRRGRLPRRRFIRFFPLDVFGLVLGDTRHYETHPGNAYTDELGKEAVRFCSGVDDECSNEERHACDYGEGFGEAVQDVCRQIPCLRRDGYLRWRTSQAKYTSGVGFGARGRRAVLKVGMLRLRGEARCAHLIAPLSMTRATTVQPPPPPGRTVRRSAADTALRARGGGV